MNITHLKYAVEVERTGSISKAAENLYMGQPNLSKAIRELENSLGLRLFKRSSAGVAPTVQGRAFLAQARTLLAQIAQMEARYMLQTARAALRVAAPRTAYVAHAFAEFAAGLGAQGMRLAFAEVDCAQALAGVAEGEYDLAVLRFSDRQEARIQGAIAERGMKGELLWAFEARLLLRAESPLLAAGELQGAPAGIEILADEEELALGEDRICARTRAGCTELLRALPNAYMWSPPLPQDELARYGLAQMRCAGAPRMRDMLVCGAEYVQNACAARFAAKLRQACAVLQEAFPLAENGL